MPEFLNVIGVINYSKGKGHISQMLPVRLDASPEGSDSQVVIRTFDDQGRRLGEFPARVNHEADPDPEAERTGVLDALVPKDAVSRVDLVVDGQLVDTRTASSYRSSRVPAIFDMLKHMAYRVGLPERNKVRYIVQVSADDGQSWDTVATDLDSPDYELRPGDYPAAENLQRRVLATDGFTTTVLERQETRDKVTG